MESSYPNCRVGIEHQHPTFIQRQVLPPNRILSRIGPAIDIPQWVMLLAVDDPHVLLRYLIILRHWRTVRVERIEHPRSPTHLHVGNRRHGRIAYLFVDQIPDFLIRLGPIVGPIATR